MEELEAPIEEPALKAIGARVLSKRIDISYRGIKVPEHSVVFIMTFLTDAGETVEHKVTKDIYEKFSEYDTGTLVTENGVFLDFGKGEEIIE